MVSQDEFFSTLNERGASRLLKTYLERDVINLHKPDQMETDFKAMGRQSYHTSNSLFFTYSQDSRPRVDIESWCLNIEGDGIQKPFSMSYNEMLKLPFTTITRYLECAYNGSSFYDLFLKRKTDGPQWHFGGYGIAEWTGIRLADLLEKAKITDNATDVLLVGMDGLNNSRPIPVEKALENDTILAYIMNGQILPLDHGFPLRAVVPGWVGVASVKWLTRVVVSIKPAYVTNNTKKYVLTGPDFTAKPPAKGSPLNSQLIKSACCLPWPAILSPGHRHIFGYAWSPFGKIAKVDVSMDQGKTFRQAKLIGQNIEKAGTLWEYHFEAVPGEMTIMPKAIDDKGNTQYEIARQKWNQYGYLFGAMVPHPLMVSEACCGTDIDRGDRSLLLPDSAGCC
jgi:DMSO/TMAO reductase YedYZ molybdopterin-dependent catalytic subunit